MDTNEVLRRLDQIDAKQEVHNEQLAIHMARTEMLEKKHDAVIKALEPLQKHVVIWSAVTKALAPVMAALAALAGIWKAFH